MLSRTTAALQARKFIIMHDTTLFGSKDEESSAKYVAIDNNLYDGLSSTHSGLRTAIKVLHRTKHISTSS